MPALDEGAIPDDGARLDAEAKRMLSRKQILARIMLRCMHELEGLTVEEVMSRIEGSPQVGEVAVGSGEPSAIAAASVEDAVPGEGRVTYDIRTSVLVPGEEGPVRVIVNVEAQRDYRPGYDIVARGFFYAGRLLSSQLETEFTHSNYDQLKKVYSIWICMGAPAAESGAISSYAVAKRDLLGSLPDRPTAYDKVEVVVVTLSQREDTGDQLVDMLSLLFSDLGRSEKLEGLRGRYNVDTRGEIEEGVNIMCNYSELVEERGVRKGLQRGIERGMQQGIEQGLQQGMQQGIERGRSGQLAELVGMNLRAGKTPESIADFLGLTVEQVEEIAKGLPPAA